MNKKLSIDELAVILESEIKQENLSQEQEFLVRMSVITLGLLLAEANFPMTTKEGLASLRIFMRSCELVAMNNENKIN